MKHYRNLLLVLRKIDLILFPHSPDVFRKLSLLEYVLFIGIGIFLFGFIASFLKPNGFIGYDWVYYFSLGQRGYGVEYYPPWIIYVSYLTWPGLIGATFTGLALALYQRRVSRGVMVAAFFSFPVWWTIFLGQVDGLVMLGLTGLPWLIPFVTLKPQVGYFACLAQKKYLMALIGWYVISIIIWGWWPLDMFGINTYIAWHQPHDINMWPWSIPIVLILFWFSRGDVDLLMLAGTFGMPYFHSYHQILIVPALARVGRWVALIAVAISWLPLGANWVGDWGWYLGHLFAIILWVALFQQRRSDIRCTKE